METAFGEQSRGGGQQLLTPSSDHPRMLVGFGVSAETRSCRHMLHPRVTPHGCPARLDVAYVDVGGDQKVGIQAGTVPAAGDGVGVNGLAVGSPVHGGQPPLVTTQRGGVIDRRAVRVAETELLPAQGLDAERSLVQEPMMATAEQDQVVQLPVLGLGSGATRPGWGVGMESAGAGAAGGQAAASSTRKSPVAAAMWPASVHTPLPPPEGVAAAEDPASPFRVGRPARARPASS